MITNVKLERVRIGGYGIADHNESDQEEHIVDMYSIDIEHTLDPAWRRCFRMTSSRDGPFR